MTTPLPRIGVIIALVALAVSTSAGSIDGFLLPRTVTADPRDIAAAATHAWVVPDFTVFIARVGLDGVTQSLHRVPDYSSTTAIALDPLDGGVWYADRLNVGRIAPTGEATNWTLPSIGSAAPSDIIVGPDDHVWIAMGSSVWRVSRTGVMTSFAVRPASLASGPDGNIWMTFLATNEIGRMTPAGTFTSFVHGDVNAEKPSEIAAGSDGKLWFTTTSGRTKDVSTAGVFAQAFDGGGFSRIAGASDGRLWWNASTSLKKWVPGAAAVESTYELGAGNDVQAISATTDAVWWASSAHNIGRVSYAGESQQWPFKPNGALVRELAATADFLWFTAPQQNQIGRSTVGGVTTLFDLPDGSGPPHSLTVGPDGAIWFTEQLADRIGRIDAAGTITEFTVPTLGGSPSGITTGPDGNLWITLEAADKIARLTPAGVFTEFAVPGLSSWPTDITSGPDGNLWFTQRGSAQIGRITPEGVITEFAAGASEPSSIVSAPDGNLWYNCLATTFRMTTAGQRTQVGLTGQVGQRIVGPDGALWDNEPNGLRRIALDGTVHAYTNGSGHAGYGVTIGPDGNIWFDDSRTQGLYRLIPDDPLAVSGTTHCLGVNGTVSGTIATFVDPDAGRAADEYQARIAWGDGTTTSSPEIVETAPGHFAVNAQHTYPSGGSVNPRVTIVALPSATRVGGSHGADVTVIAPSIVPATREFSRAGGNGSLEVSAGDSCSWTATKDVSWIVFPNGASGSGSGTLQFSVLAHDGTTQRSGTITVGGNSVLVFQRGIAGTGLYLVTPCRLFDSRDGGTRIGSDTTWPLGTAGICGIPSGATAIVANITVIDPAADGWLSLYRYGEAWPGSSTINYRRRKTRANNAIVALGGNALQVLNRGTAVDFVIDVTGYFKPF